MGTTQELIIINISTYNIERDGERKYTNKDLL